MSLGRGLAGIFDSAGSPFAVLDAIQDGTNAACSQFASFDLVNTDANIIDVRDNWHPTGFYTPDQMQKIVQFALEVKGKAHEALAAAEGELQIESHRKALDKALENIQDPLIDPSPFINALHDAFNQQIDVIESQGFKRWIVNVLRAARDAEFTVKMIGCARPSVLFSVLKALNKAADVLVQFVKLVGTVIAKAGQLILKIPDLLSSVVSFLKILPWFVLAFGGYYAGIKTGVIPQKFDPLKLRERETFRPWNRR